MIDLFNRKKVRALQEEIAVLKAWQEQALLESRAWSEQLRKEARFVRAREREALQRRAAQQAERLAEV